MKGTLTNNKSGWIALRGQGFLRLLPQLVECLPCVLASQATSACHQHIFPNWESVISSTRHDYPRWLKCCPCQRNQFGMYLLSEWLSENHIDRRQSLSWDSLIDWGICRKSDIRSTTANYLFILLFLSKSLKCCICKVLRRVTYSLSSLNHCQKEHHGNQK